MIDFMSLPVWAAGVTYRRSVEGRHEEAREPSIYDRVYDAERPQLFFKCAAGQAVAYGDEIGLRGDSAWIVPEPELVVIADERGQIVGVTLGNDVSCRDIEGENILYQPQAKVFTGSCALGPRMVTIGEAVAPWLIEMTIQRDGVAIFHGESSTKLLKRSLTELIAALFAYQEFPDGVALMTGTGIVPPPGLSLRDGDVVAISSPRIGTLINRARLLPARQGGAA